MYNNDNDGDIRNQKVEIYLIKTLLSSCITFNDGIGEDVLSLDV